MHTRLHKPQSNLTNSHNSLFRRKVISKKQEVKVNFPEEQLHKAEEIKKVSVLEESAQPSVIYEALNYAKKRSVTFAVLMQRNGITLTNYSEIISLSNTMDTLGNTDPETKKIRIKTTTDISTIILVLAHEMTNRLLTDKFKRYEDLVAKGEITPKQFALKWAELEKEGEINQLKVAAQIEYSYDDENIDKLLEQYNNDKTTDIRARVVAGTTHLARYEQLGLALRERYLSKKANIQTVEGSPNFRFDSNVAKRSSKGNYLIVKSIDSGKEMNVVRDPKTGKYSKYED